MKFKKTRRIESECQICPLRNKNGDCIKDIIDNYGLGIETEISEIWRCFFESKNTKVN